MNMQARFDLETAEDALAPQIRKTASVRGGVSDRVAPREVEGEAWRQRRHLSKSVAACTDDGIETIPHVLPEFLPKIPSPLYIR
jgi:hypothetical protein